METGTPLVDVKGIDISWWGEARQGIHAKEEYRANNSLYILNCPFKCVSYK